MAGPVKTVSFIASLVITWGLIEVGGAVYAWFDHKINGTEIAWSLEHDDPTVQRMTYHIISILVHELLLQGISKEKTSFIEPWIMLYSLFTLVTLFPIGILGMKSFINLCFLPNHFEIEIFQYQWICIFLTIQLYGSWIGEIYGPIKEKEDAQRKKRFNEWMAKSDEKEDKIEEDEKTKEGEKNTISEKDPGMVV